MANPGKASLVKLRSIYVNDKTGFDCNTKLYEGNYEANDLKMPDYLLPVQEETKLSMRLLTSKAAEYPKHPES